mgnify:CR=1 FL=1
MLNRRRVLLVNRKFQFRFTFYICSWLFILSLSYPVIIYNLFDFFIKFLKLGPGPDAVQILENTQGEILWLLVALHLVFLAVTFLICLFLSHRIAGPLFNLQRRMQDVKEGRLSSDLQFRKSDHFPELAIAYNEMVQGIQGRTQGNSDLSSSSTGSDEKP